MTKSAHRPNPASKAAIRAWAGLVRVESRVLARVHAALKAAGLPPLNWYDVLLELHRAGADGLRQYEIGDRVLLPKYNLSRLIDRLEKEQLVERSACPEDGRGHVVRVTTNGTDLLHRMWPVYGRVIHEELDSRLSTDELALLGRIVDRLR